MARSTSSARRYAEAAFAVAGGSASFETWRDDLERAGAALSEPGLAQVLANPAIPLVERERLLAETVGRGLTDKPLNLLRLLLRRGRIELLPKVAADFGTLDDRRQGLSRALVTSAEPLAAGELLALTERLERLSGGRAILSTQTDPSLLGGLVIRIGDRLIDGSVRGRLARLRGRLTSGAI